VKLLSESVDKLYLISSGVLLQNLELDDNVLAFRVNHRPSSNAVMRAVNYLYTQLKILRYVMVTSKRINIFIFFLGGEGLLIPMLILKLLRKKTLLIFSEIAIKVYAVRNDPLSKFMSLLVRINSRLADKLVLYSHNLISEGKFTRYQHKIIIAHRHFVDFNMFSMKKKIDNRLKIVGYIGRLSEEKGILKLIRAIPLVLKERRDVQFIICGQGKLSDKIKRFTEAEGLKAHIIHLNEWIPHEDVPQYLNEFKLLVLPSFTEGLPNILLEAMACGTPVLAAPVGAIPDIVIEGKTGFLLKSTRPEHIAERVVSLLSNPDMLERVSKEACKFVRKMFCFEKTSESWRDIFKESKIHTEEWAL